MELTLKRLLEQAEFTLLKGRGRGYDQTEVDDFLDRASAMAAKVEVQLSQALEQAAQAGSSAGVDVEAEIERRVAERLAHAPAGASEEEVAAEAQRTLVLAQRTADAAVREAREDAEKLLADARERAQTMVAEAEARAAQTVGDAEAYASQTVADAESRAAALASDAEAQVARERREARQRLAAEIGELEGVREALRSDVTVLERHVEEQRTQLASTVGELQRLLEDPAGFRLAPVPVLLEPEIPDLRDDEPAEEPPSPAAEGEAEPLVDDEPAAPPPAEVVEPVTVEPAPIDPAPVEPPRAEAAATEPPPGAGGGPGGEPRLADRSSATAFAAEPEARPTMVAQPLTFDEVDHAAPEARQHAAEDSGPPTAPVSAVDLGIDLRAGASGPADARPEPGVAVHDDDAFLAELRKAMADDEPLGPRDHDEDQRAGDMFDEDRRGWRFRRR